MKKAWSCLALWVLVLMVACSGVAEPQKVEANICVPYVAGSESEDFIRGVDISSLLSLLDSGVVFHDFDGAPLDGVGFCRLLAGQGVNWVRLRVWNDPYDGEGHGYGGGNNDLNTAVTMGRWATEAGMQVLIDFHYSDFWADPGKQQAPKAWQSLSLEDKEQAIERYTLDSLRTLLESGVHVGMVQVGNETNGRFCGENSWASITRLFSAGSRAVRQAADEAGMPIRVALHFTNPERNNWVSYVADQLNKAQVDYDVFAVSCYPYWHGTPENLTQVLSYPASRYGKQVMVAETSWAYALADADGHENTVRVGNNDTNAQYPFSVQGQAMEIADMMQAVANVGEAGVGVFYWEPAWIPVRPCSPEDKDAQVQIAENRMLWEEFGSGWASSYAGAYDPEDEGRWYGGSAVDNQALFDAQGYPLESLQVFRYVQTGTTGYDVVPVDVERFTQEYGVGDTLVLPETARVSYNDRTQAVLPIVWNQEELSAIDMEKAGEYLLHGTVEGDVEITCAVSVRYTNLLRNPGFEEADMSMYAISQPYASRTTDDPASGAYSLHFWTAGIVDFTAEQTLRLKPGTYEFSLTAQGGDMGDTGESHAYVRIGGEEIIDAFALTGWIQWVHPTIRFTLEEECDVSLGVAVHAGKDGAWGTFDDWNLTNVE